MFVFLMLNEDSRSLASSTIPKAVTAHRALFSTQYQTTIFHVAFVAEFSKMLTLNALLIRLLLAPQKRISLKVFFLVCCVLYNQSNTTNHSVVSSNNLK